MVQVVTTTGSRKDSRAMTKEAFASLVARQVLAGAQFVPIRGGRVALVTAFQGITWK